MPEFLAQVRLDELELEFRAQIEVVLAAGLHPTHLDWHSLRISSRGDIFDVMFRLARAYGLALRVFTRSFIEKLQSQGFPTNDYDVLDSYLLDPATKAARYAELLHELPAGLSEWAVHPGLDTPEFLAIEPAGNHIRQTDYDFLDLSTGKRYRPGRRYHPPGLSSLAGCLERKVSSKENTHRCSTSNL